MPADVSEVLVDLQEDRFPKAVCHMTGLKWLRVDRAHLEWVPPEVASLTGVQSLSFARNSLITMHGEMARLSKLRFLNCRYNQLNDSAFPNDFFERNSELLVIDLSHNQLKEVPESLEHSRKLLVLNLSHNLIEYVPPQLFVNLTQLVHLDLSNNQLETIPPQLRRLTCLQTLILSDNPLGQNQLRQLPSLTNLRCLSLRNTQRSPQNLPTSLETLDKVTDIDLSQNDLLKVPSLLFSLPNLKRINLSGNQISDLPPDLGDFWKDLESLNLARNRLKSLPNSLCKMERLKRLFLSSNQLDFDGIPSGIGKLANLQVFDACYNNLEVIPEGVVRCGRLKRLLLSHNRLITLPDAIHLLSDIEKLDLSDNPNLVMPPKPPEYHYISRGSGIEFYNIDFSLNTQLRLVGAAPPPNSSQAAPGNCRNVTSSAK
jgi:Leucine-rich repeat (LRR) protein